MRISDWSSDVCSSDLEGDARFVAAACVDVADRGPTTASVKLLSVARRSGAVSPQRGEWHGAMGVDQPSQRFAISGLANMPVVKMGELTQTCAPAGFRHPREAEIRSEEHTSELQSLMPISYAVFCL